MPAAAFISYSHADERALGRLHKHLAMLRWDNLLADWTDHEILPGPRLDATITTALEGSSLFLALASPDYLASNYCYDKEFARALELEKEGRLRIVPIILQPCDWLSSPLKDFLALPKEGKPVSDWTNENNAYLDVVTGLRKILEGAGREGELTPARGTPAATSGRKVRVKRDFDSIQKAEFVDEAFAAMRDYFVASCRELSSVGDGDLKAKYESMGDNAFTCTIVNRAKRSGGEAHITIWNNKHRRHFGDISYSHERHAPGNSSNGSIRIEADDYSLYLTMDRFFGNDEGQRYTGKQAAESLWSDLAEKAGIEYE